MTQKGENFRICLPRGSKVKVLEGNDIIVTAPNPFDRVPHSIEEFCEMCPNMTNEYYLNTDDEVSQYSIPLEDYKRTADDKVVFYTGEDADAFVALAQLRRIWHEWVKVLGEPIEGKYCWCISFNINADTPVVVSYNKNFRGALCFKEENHATRFLECFFDLLLVASPLL